MNVRLILKRAMVAGIIAASIYFGIQNLRTAITVGNLGKDSITEWEVRFNAVKNFCPSSAASLAI